MHLRPLLLLVLLSACHRGDSPPADADADSEDTAMASMVPADAQATPGYGLPHAGSWDSTRVAEGGEFTLTVPAVANARWRDIDRPANRKFWVSELPECTWPCYVTVSTFEDSRRLGPMRWMRDAFRMDAPMGTSDFDHRPTVLPPVLLGSDTALRLSLYCGDCTSEALITARKGRIAVIEYSLDKRDGVNASLLGHLRALSRTFRWSD